jgi:hypothetical protein
MSPFLSSAQSKDVLVRSFWSGSLQTPFLTPGIKVIHAASEEFPTAGARGSVAQVAAAPRAAKRIFPNSPWSHPPPMIAVASLGLLA